MFPAGGFALEVPPILPEPCGLALVERTTTSLEIKWDVQHQLLASAYANAAFWFVQFCKSDDTEILGDCTFPLSTNKAPVKGLQPGCDYKISLRLELRHSQAAAASACSAWTAQVFSTLDVAASPTAPPRPVVVRVSSTIAEVTILASPCCRHGAYMCAQSYLLQRLEGSLPKNGSREDEWKSVPEVTTSCAHPKTPEIVPSLEKKKVPLAADRTYHFRVRATNSKGTSAWSEIASTLAPPACPEVRVEQVKSESATLVWAPPEDNGFAVRCYNVHQCRADDEDDVKMTVVPVTPAHAHAHALKSSPPRQLLLHGEDLAARSACLHAGTWQADMVTYQAQNLQANCCFKFWVRAVSDAGQSDPVAPLYVVTQPLPPPLPCGVVVKQIKPNAMTVAWSISDMNEANKVSACEICWREVGADCMPMSLSAADDDDNQEFDRWILRQKSQCADGEMFVSNFTCVSMHMLGC
jgi:hypothetical protein